MPLQKRVKNTYLFPNGNLAAFDLHGQQIPELQGTYSIDKHKRILLEALDECQFQGFNILPNGFTQNAYEYAEYFRVQKMSYEEIEAI